MTFKLGNITSVEMSNGKVFRPPSFVHVGPVRTGTTWLHAVLPGHVDLPSVKETQFFDANFFRGFEWYTGLFPASSPRPLLGELCPVYFSSAVARTRIRQYAPDCKIVCCFREPAARLYSFYRSARAERRDVQRTFEAFIRFQINGGSDLCGYATQLRRWQKTFGENQVLVQFYEDLIAEPQSYLGTFCDFIGLARFAIDTSAARKIENFRSEWRAAKQNPIARFTVKSIDWLTTRGAASMVRLGRKSSARRLLRQVFMEEFQQMDPSVADDIRQNALAEVEDLERLTGRDLSAWKPLALREMKIAETAAELHPERPAGASVRA
jgi:hypothetical protein